MVIDIPVQKKISGNKFDCLTGRNGFERLHDLGATVGNSAKYQNSRSNIGVKYRCC